MKKLVIASALIALTAGSVSHAEKISADHFGLTPETSYLEAVTPDEPCDQWTQVKVVKECDSFKCYPKYIYKCDSTAIVGWVSKEANGADLELDTNPLGQFDDDPFDFKLMLNTGNDIFGNPEYLNIYTCGSSRNQDLQKAPRYVSRSPIVNYNKLMDIKRRKLNFRIRLFYNEYVLSGKCIGDIEIIN